MFSTVGVVPVLVASVVCAIGATLHAAAAVNAAIAIAFMLLFIAISWVGKKTACVTLMPPRHQQSVPQ